MELIFGQSIAKVNLTFKDEVNRPYIDCVKWNAMKAYLNSL